MQSLIYQALRASFSQSVLAYCRKVVRRRLENGTDLTDLLTDFLFPGISSGHFCINGLAWISEAGKNFAVLQANGGKWTATGRPMLAYVDAIRILEVKK